MLLCSKQPTKGTLTIILNGLPNDPSIRRKRNPLDALKSFDCQTEVQSRYADVTSILEHLLTRLLRQLGMERFKAPEILFNPEQIGLEYAGVHQVVVDSINRVDLDLRKSLFSNIVLSGGSTLCTGNLGSIWPCSRLTKLPPFRFWRPLAKRSEKVGN